MRELKVSLKGLTIGRASSNDVILEDVHVSRQHAFLVAMPCGDIAVIDRNSANGTAVKLPDGTWRRVENVMTVPHGTVMKFDNYIFQVFRE